MKRFVDLRELILGFKFKNMKIAIISDSHDNIPNIDKMLAFVKKEKIKIMLHCGDVCAPGVMKYIAEKFKNDIFHVYGNADGDHEKMEEFSKKHKNWHLLGETGNPKIMGVKERIGMTHYPWQSKEMANTGKYDIIFYGHSHKPWDEIIGNARVLNPGTLAGLFQKATFAVWDTESGDIELKILEIMQLK